MKKLIEMRDALEREISERLEEIKEDYPDRYANIEKEYFSFYDFGITEGEPHAFGNATDCYDDGFDLGIKQGKLELLNKIINGELS